MLNTTCINFIRAISALTVLSACAPGPDYSCNNPAACTAAAEYATLDQAGVGVDDGSGVVLNSVAARGATVVYDVILPVSLGQLLVSEAIFFASATGEIMAAELCSSPRERELIQLGTDFQVRFFDLKGGYISDVWLYECVG